MGQVILVVEDHDELRDEVALVLETENYVVHTAADGREALEMLHRDGWCPDLIVSDIAMPHMDGYELFLKVHAIPSLSVIPFIFLTARGTRQDISIGRKLGVDDYLVKPFEPEEFLAAVGNKLKRSAQVRIQAASELDDARRTMVQLLAHELRTPETYILGGLSLLYEELEQAMSPDAEVSLGLIRSGALRMSRLTEQMVLFAELSSGHIRIQLEAAGEKFSLESLLNATIATHQADADERSVHISLIKPCSAGPCDETLTVFGIADILSKGLGEIIRNAINYSSPGSEVRVYLHQEGDQAMIQVIDYGRGIIAEDLKSIWNVLI